MRKSAALAAVLLASCKADVSPAITIEEAWARATVASQPSTAAYFTVRNTGGEDRLISISSPAGDASLHSTSMNGGVMRMRPLDSLDIPADSTVILKPGGTHVMLTGLNAPLTAGSSFPLDLAFEKSGKLQVKVTVRPATTSGGAM